MEIIDTEKVDCRLTIPTPVKQRLCLTRCDKRSVVNDVGEEQQHSDKNDERLN
jgi:hypothetical protein